MRSTRTRTNVGITSRRIDESDRPNLHQSLKTPLSSNEFLRTSLPMFNNRGGQGPL